MPYNFISNGFDWWLLWLELTLLFWYNLKASYSLLSFTNLWINLGSKSLGWLHFCVCFGPTMQHLRSPSPTAPSAAMSIRSPQQLPTPLIWPFPPTTSQPEALPQSNSAIDTTSIHKPLAIASTQSAKEPTLRHRAQYSPSGAQQQPTTSSHYRGCIAQILRARLVWIFGYKVFNLVRDNKSLGRRDWNHRNSVFLYQWCFRKRSRDWAVDKAVLALDNDWVFFYKQQRHNRGKLYEDNKIYTKGDDDGGLQLASYNAFLVWQYFQFSWKLYMLGINSIYLPYFRTLIYPPWQLALALSPHLLKLLLSEDSWHPTRLWALQLYSPLTPCVTLGAWLPLVQYPSNLPTQGSSLRTARE